MMANGCLYGVISLKPHKDAENWSSVPAKNVALSLLSSQSPVYTALLVVDRHVE